MGNIKLINNMKNTYKLLGASIIAALAIFSLSAAMSNAQVTTPTTCPAGSICTPPTIPETCYVFNMNLQIGSRGNDVDALVAFLIKKGFIQNPSNEPVFGEDFNQEVANAVSAYQTSKGLPATGFVGPLTKAAMNAECGPVIPTAPSITVLSPNGGEVWSKGTSQTVKWLNIDRGSRFDIGIMPYPANEPTYHVAKEILTTSQNGSYEWTLDKVTRNSDSAPIDLPPGDYRLFVGQSGAGTKDSDISDSYFTISSTSTPVSNASAKVTSSKLDLSYNSFLKEGMLTAQFDISVDGGNTGINIYKEGISTGFTDQKGNDSNTPRIIQPLVPQSSLRTVTDQNGSTLFVIPAGQIAKFKATAATDPKKMFAGTYYARLYSISANSTSDASKAFNMEVPANKTNTKTIIGEKSPYINSINGPLKSGNIVVVKGERLNDSSINIDDIVQKISSRVTKDGKTLSFILPKLTNGQHILTLRNKEGLSNRGYFEVGGTLQSNSSANVVPGKLVLRYDSNRNEAVLTAPFSVTITAGSNDVMFEEGSFAVSYLGKGVQRNVTTKIGSINGRPVSVPFRPYILKAGQKVEFTLGASADPLKMFAGYYTFSLTGIFATHDNGGEKESESFTINENTTNSVVIVGEKSPYINFVTSPIKSGEKLMLEGARLNASDMVYVDGAVLTGITPDTSKDFRTFWFVLPSLSNGQHIISLYNKVNGASNTLRFDVEGGSTQPSIKVLSPNGGENFIAGGKLEGALSSSGFPVGTTYEVALVGKAYDVDIGYGLIASNSGDKQPLSVTIPSNVPPASYYRFRLAVCADQNPKLNIPAGTCIQDQSDKDFTVTTVASTPTITVLGPNGGDFWRIGDSYTVNYSTTGNLQGPIRVYLDKFAEPSSGKSGLNSTTLLGETTNSRSFSYTVPGSFNSNPGQGWTFKIRVCDASTKCSVSDSSDNFFSIAPQVLMVYPNGGETLRAGDTVTIKWNKENVPSRTVDISLLDDPTRYGSVIIPNTPNDGSESWVVRPLSQLEGKDGKPIAPSGRYVAFVSCSDSNCIVDDSNSYFSIYSTPDNSSNSYLPPQPSTPVARTGLGASVIDAIGGFFSKLYGFDGN